MMMALSYLWPPEAKVKSYTAFERKKKKYIVVDPTADLPSKP